MKKILPSVVSIQLLIMIRFSSKMNNTRKNMKPLIEKKDDEKGKQHCCSINTLSKQQQITQNHKNVSRFSTFHFSRMNDFGHRTEGRNGELFPVKTPYNRDEIRRRVESGIPPSTAEEYLLRVRYVIRKKKDARTT